MEISKIKLTQIQKAEYNPRVITEEAKKKLENSIKNFGLVEPIVINLKNNTIISGHQRYDILTDMELIDGNLAEQEYQLIKYGDLGLILTEDEPVLKDEDWEKALNITLNNTNLTGDYNFEQLGSLLEELELSDFDISLTGFDDLTLEDMGLDLDLNFGNNDYPPIEVVEDDFEVEDDIEVNVEKGDLYRLGNHYLLCGDATNEEDILKLVSASGERERIDITFTSPPYNIGGGVDGKPKYLNFDDDLTQEEYFNFLKSFTENALENCEYVFINIQMLSNNKIALINFIHHMKEKYADTIIWDKINCAPSIGANVLNKMYEYIFIFSNKGNQAVGTIPFRGTVNNIFHIGRDYNKYSDKHKAIFPIELPTNIISNFAKESVMDLFGGTGTTLISAEQLGKKCYAMDIEPYYCQLIINRWEEFTGLKVEKIN